MTVFTKDYVDLITSEHADQPSFIATVGLSVTPFVDNQNITFSIPPLYDIDVAVGQQLDVVGQWVGRSRYLIVPLDIWFSWDTTGLGWDEGVWATTYGGQTNIFVLADEQYRLLLYAVIVANNWDGTVPGAYEAWDRLFAPTPYRILIQDYCDMSMAIALVGATADPVTQALFTTGQLDLKPVGVKLYHVIPSDIDAPLFGWDAENDAVAGWDHGAWGTFTPPY